MIKGPGRQRLQHWTEAADAQRGRPLVSGQSQSVSATGEFGLLTASCMDHCLKKCIPPVLVNGNALFAWKVGDQGLERVEIRVLPTYVQNNIVEWATHVTLQFKRMIGEKVQ